MTQSDTLQVSPYAMTQTSGSTTSSCQSWTAPFFQALSSQPHGILVVNDLLKHLVSAFGLDAAMLVTEHPYLGLQAFRFEKVLQQAPYEPTNLVGHPGLHTSPTLDDPELSLSVASLADLAISLHVKHHMASTDTLTHLSNRAVFQAELAKALERFKRHNEGFVLMILDVDGLKALNDAKGHQGGDKALCQVALSLKRASRSSDLVARIGGDEFGAILTPAPSDEHTFVASFHARLDRDLKLSASPRVSIGWAACPADHSEASALIALADERLYRSKRTKQTDPLYNTSIEDSLLGTHTAASITSENAADLELELRMIQDVVEVELRLQSSPCEVHLGLAERSDSDTAGANVLQRAVDILRRYVRDMPIVVAHNVSATRSNAQPGRQRIRICDAKHILSGQWQTEVCLSYAGRTALASNVSTDLPAGVHATLKCLLGLGFDLDVAKICCHLEQRGDVGVCSLEILLREKIRLCGKASGHDIPTAAAKATLNAINRRLSKHEPSTI
ncbi:MAG: GGDEF domain-containing protein [Actinobacteria bacterium]|nr:GGDEF domain-containing protein [Actinomycetota bacterium]